jgi:glycerol uptake facilitator protein
VGPQTGAAINPARYTGTLFTSAFAGLSTDWGQVWVYWAADVAGALAGVFAYDLLAKPRVVAYGRPAVEPAHESTAVESAA